MDVPGVQGSLGSRPCRGRRAVGRGRMHVHRAGKVQVYGRCRNAPPQGMGVCGRPHLVHLALHGLEAQPDDEVILAAHAGRLVGCLGTCLRGSAAATAAAAAGTGRPATASCRSVRIAIILGAAGSEGSAITGCYAVQKTTRPHTATPPTHPFTHPLPRATPNPPEDILLLPPQEVGRDGLAQLRRRGRPALPLALGPE